MNRGYIKIWRKLEDSGLFQVPNTLAVFMYILMHATHQERKIGTPTGVITLQRGQLISGRIKLSIILKQSERQIRTSIDRLTNMQIMTIKTTNKYSIYTIVNYSIYQDIEDDSAKQTTSKRPANDQQTTTKQAFKHLSIEEGKAIAIGKPNCPHEEIINLYHELLPASPRIKDWTPARAASLKARWNEETDRQTLDYWRRLFDYISGIPFLTGKVTSNGRKPFVITLDWLVKSENFAKVLEGRYEDNAA